MTPTYNTVQEAVQILVINKRLAIDTAEAFMEHCFALRMGYTWRDIRERLEHTFPILLVDVECLHKLNSKKQSIDTSEQLDIELFKEN